MLKWLEIVSAAVLALGFHAAIFLTSEAPEGAAASMGGAGGGVVMVADNEIAQLVEEWTKPPEPKFTPKSPEPPKVAALSPSMAVAPVDRQPPKPPEQPKKEPEKEPKKQPSKKPKKVEKKKSQAKAASSRGAAGKAVKSRDSSGRGQRASSGDGRAAASLLKQWGGRIRAEISRQRKYPSAARRNRVSGTVVVRLTVSRNGGLISASISRSSGSRLLDSAALNAARSAAPFARAPSGLTRASYRFAVPVSFRVR